MNVHVHDPAYWNCCACGLACCQRCFRQHDCLTIRHGVTAVPLPADARVVRRPVFERQGLAEP